MLATHHKKKKTNKSIIGLFSGAYYIHYPIIICANISEHTHVNTIDQKKNQQFDVYVEMHPPNSQTGNDNNHHHHLIFGYLKMSVSTKCLSLLIMIMNIKLMLKTRRKKN